MSHDDEMLMDEAFADSLFEDDAAPALDSGSSSQENYNNLPSDGGEDEWDNTNEFPGQLAVDVYETADRVIVKARTAGVNADDLDISISDNILTISGTLNDGDNNRDGKTIRWHIQECYWGEFSRTIAIPVQVHEENIEAELDNGVLTLSFEKEKVEGPTKIKVRQKN